MRLIPEYTVRISMSCKVYPRLHHLPKGCGVEARLVGPQLTLRQFHALTFPRVHAHKVRKCLTAKDPSNTPRVKKYPESGLLGRLYQLHHGVGVVRHILFTHGQDHHVAARLGNLIHVPPYVVQVFGTKVAYAKGQTQLNASFRVNLYIITPPPTAAIPKSATPAA